MKILLVEDDEILLKIMEHRLQLSGDHQVLTALNGREGRKLAEQHEPEMVITDMLMPQYSGAELINYIRQELRLPAHIIAISAIDVDEYSSEVLDLGADRFVAKPFDLDEFIESVRSHINVAQAS